MYVISGIMLTGNTIELSPNKFQENVQFQWLISHFGLPQSNYCSDLLRSKRISLGDTSV